MVISDIGQELYNAWLDGPFASEVLNEAAHLAAIATGSALNYFKINPSGDINKEGNALLNEALRILNDPNIEGIPIKAERQRVTRDVDITEQMIIAQDETGTGGKNWTTDNAAPRPRVWEVQGYLEPLSNVLDAYLLVKPTLALQVAILDACAKSRRPVWFKPHYFSFYKVLVEKFDCEFDPKTQNAIAVSIVLREFVPYKLAGPGSGSLVGELVSDSLEKPVGF
jgi:hypothetical protein